LLLYNVYFNLLDAGKITQVSFCDLHSAVVYPWSWLISYEVVNNKIGRVSWFVDFISRFSRELNHAHKSWANWWIPWHFL